MALPSTLVLEVRVPGDDRNGAGFDPSVASPGVDYSQQDAAAVVYTDLLIGATTTQVTSAANPFGATYVGNTVQIAAIYAPVVTATVSVTGGGATGGSLQAGAYRLKYTFVGSTGSGTGESTVSPETAQFTVAAGNIPQVTLPPLPPGVTSISVYLTAAGGAAGTETLYAAGVTAQTYNLSAAQSAGASPPASMPSGFQGGFYNVRSVASAVATLDRSCGSAASTGGAGRLGGALASPGKAAGAVVSGNTVWVKSGTYSVTTATANVSGGPVSVGSPTSVVFEGYGVSRGDRAARPVFSAGVGSVTLWGLGGSANGCAFICLAADGNGHTSVTGVSAGSSRTTLYLCSAASCALGLTGPNCLSCYASGCTTGYQQNAVRCVASGCATGFAVNGACVSCIAQGGTTGFVLLSAGSQNQTVGCIAYGCGGNGFDSNQSGGLRINCLAVGCAGKGFIGLVTPASADFLGCAAYNNAGGNDSGTVAVALTADPFVDAPNGNFGLNNVGDAFGQTTGLTGVLAGRYLRGAGLGTFPGLPNTVGYPDIGAVQHADSGGGLLFGANWEGGYE